MSIKQSQNIVRYSSKKYKVLIEIPDSKNRQTKRYYANDESLLLEIQGYFDKFEPALIGLVKAFIAKIGGPAKFQSYEEIRFFSFVFSLYQHVSNIIVTRATLEWPKITNDTVILNKLYRGVFAKFIKLQANLSRVLYEAGIEPHDIFFNHSWMLTPEVIYDGKIVTHKFNLPKDRVNLVVDIAWSIGAPFARCASEKLGRNVDVDPYPDKWSAAGGWEHAFGYWLNEQSKQQQEQQQQHKRK